MVTLLDMLRKAAELSKVKVRQMSTEEREILLASEARRAMEEQTTQPRQFISTEVTDHMIINNNILQLTGATPNDGPYFLHAGTTKIDETSHPDQLIELQKEG